MALITTKDYTHSLKGMINGTPNPTLSAGTNVIQCSFGHSDDNSGVGVIKIRVPNENGKLVVRKTITYTIGTDDQYFEAPVSIRTVATLAEESWDEETLTLKLSPESFTPPGPIEYENWGKITMSVSGKLVDSYCRVAQSTLLDVAGNGQAQMELSFRVE